MERLDEKLLLTREEQNINQFICSTFKRVVIDEKQMPLPQEVTEFIQNLLQEGATHA